MQICLVILNFCNHDHKSLQNRVECGHEKRRLYRRTTIHPTITLMLQSTAITIMLKSFIQVKKSAKQMTEADIVAIYFFSVFVDFFYFLCRVLLCTLLFQYHLSISLSFPPCLRSLLCALSRLFVNDRKSRVCFARLLVFLPMLWRILFRSNRVLRYVRIYSQPGITALDFYF
jgi:hypothetical protein